MPEAENASGASERDLRELLVQEPADGGAWCALGGRSRHVLAFTRALASLPLDIDVLGGLAATLIDAGDYRRARLSLARGIALAPHRADLHQIASHLAYSEARSREALTAARRALSIEAVFAAAQRSLHFGQLQHGDFEHGFAAFGPEFRSTAALPLPLWTGGRLPNDMLLVVGEEGFGDMIQMARFLPLLPRMGVRATVVVPPPLLRLLSGMPGISVTAQASAEGYDAWIPIMAMPSRMAAAAARAVTGERYLAPPSDGPVLPPSSALTVGLCWRGRASHPHDRVRSLPFERLAPLLEVPGARFVSLIPDTDEKSLLAVPLADFADTAFVASQLDLIISVDSAVAHLGGSLGVPTWVLLSDAPEWRWGSAGSVTPWYASARIYRSARGAGLPSVVPRVAADLHALARLRSASPRPQ